jgi:hypothetical protein
MPTFVRFAWPLLCLCGNAVACDMPTLASIPADVNDDVASVLRDVRRYSDSMVDYNECLKGELESAGGDAAPPLVRSIIITRNNYAAAEHRAVLDLYAQRVGPLVNLRLAEYLDGESRDCVLADSVVRTGVVSDGAVLFFLRGNQAYLNLLTANCPDLEREGDFLIADATGSAASSIVVDNPVFGTPLVSRVCDRDGIFPYVARSTRRVPSCPLGRFYAISVDEAQELLSSPQPAAANAPAAAEAP